MTYYLGIDPGLSGALAFYAPEKDALIIHDMPVHPAKVNGKKKNTIDIYRLAQLMDSMSTLTVMAVIEEVAAMPGQGVSSMFSFGFSAGCVHMAVASQFIPLRTITPSVWKKALRLSHDKEGSRREASRLLPKHIDNWSLVKHDGRAEAALLAYYLAKCEAEKPVSEMSIEELL